MTCDALRPLLLDLLRGRLDPPREAEARAHLAGCPGCARALEAERALDEALARRPRHRAPPELRARLSELVERAAQAPPARRPAARPRLSRLLGPAAAALAAGVLVASGLLLHQDRSRLDEARTRLRVEAVNDHLRLLHSERPLEVEAGGPHQVKPWFQGRIDFSPSVPVPPNLVLRGGAVGWFHDREAAVISYTLRLHHVTLLEFRAEGLPWPAADSPRAEPPHRGFNVIAWRHGDLGYALVSDANAAELSQAAQAIASSLGPGT